MRGTGLTTQQLHIFSRRSQKSKGELCPGGSRVTLLPFLPPNVCQLFVFTYIQLKRVEVLFPAKIIHPVWRPLSLFKFGWMQGGHRWDISNLIRWTLSLRTASNPLLTAIPARDHNEPLSLSSCRHEPFSGALHPELHHHQPALHRGHGAPGI